jgi:signal transduction histidine kinase/CheY-like chemotaxis protein
MIDEMPVAAVRAVVFLELLGLAVLYLGVRQFLLARIVMIVGSATCILLLTGEVPTAVFLFTPMAMFMFSVFRMRVALLVLSAVSILILSSLQHPAMPLITLWTTVLVGGVVIHNLKASVEMLAQSQATSRGHINALRERRAELVAVVKILNETQERLKRKSAQLQQVYQVAEEARRLKAQFAANVSHELRTPINLIVGFSEMIYLSPEAYNEALPPVYRADVRAIYRNARHLQELINDILDMSQLEAAHLVIVKEQSDLQTVIEEAVEITSSLVTTKGLEYHLDIPHPLPEIRLDRTRMRQVLINLVANAVRFTSTGSITITAHQQFESVNIAVIDTGIGIPKESINKVFDEFYQVQHSEAHEAKGIGLGLALSRKLIQQHGGDLWVESKGVSGCGSTFTFSLPLDEEGAYVRGREVGLQTVLNDVKKHVVLWEEDIMIAHLFRGYAQHADIHWCKSFDQVKRALRQTYSVAVLVHGERDTHALETYLASINRNVAIIRCPMPSGKRSMLQHDVADYLVKPVSYQVLTETLEKLETQIKHVLIIDDERDIQRMFTRMLYATGRQLTIAQANNGREGLEMMQTCRPDVVILDILMPELDGLGVIKMMKSDPTLKQIPIIVISARGTNEAILPHTFGEITMYCRTGYRPIELVNYVDALISMSNYPGLPEPVKTRLD